MRGILLVNLGTPDAPTPEAIRRYLREFLSDPRVVQLPRLLWLPVLYGFILPLRPRRLVAAYEKVWTPQGSPLLAITRRQQDALQVQLEGRVAVAIGMTYGTPSIASGLDQLRQQGVDEIVVLPLYPQYSHTTTAAVGDALARAQRAQPALPPLRMIGDYHAHPAYIEALAHSVREYWQARSRSAYLLMSFHSIPQRYVDAGDPYQAQCETTARLLAKSLHLADGQWSIAYQSRLGREPWLQPYTDMVLPQLARSEGNVDVICPGFAADCLETLEEVAIRYRESFLGSGGRAFSYIPALNARADHVAALRDIAGRG